MRILVDKETGEEFKVQSDISDYLVVAPLPKKLKVIDWSKVADCVPVKRQAGCVSYPSTCLIKRRPGDSLETGVKVAWTGDKCPLPEGVLIKCGLRDWVTPTVARAESVLWRHYGRPSDIIWFEVVGLEEDYCYE